MSNQICIFTRETTKLGLFHTSFVHSQNFNSPWEIKQDIAFVIQYSLPSMTTITLESYIHFLGLSSSGYCKSLVHFHPFFQISVVEKTSFLCEFLLKIEEQFQINKVNKQNREDEGAYN